MWLCSAHCAVLPQGWVSPEWASFSDVSTEGMPFCSSYKDAFTEATGPLFWDVRWPILDPMVDVFPSGPVQVGFIGKG